MRAFTAVLFTAHAFIKVTRGQEFVVIDASEEINALCRASHALYSLLEPQIVVMVNSVRPPFALKRAAVRARQAVPSLPDESGLGFALKRFAVRARRAH